MSAVTVRRAIEVHGVVQGVGFRPFVFALAERHALGGFVRNAAGQVEIEVEGDEREIDRFVEDLESEKPPLARIESVVLRELVPVGERAFTIRESTFASENGGARPVPPDVATCEACLAELFDPADRRYRYPFINCTNCGPRFTIIADLPYDRARTSMARFPLCEACRREYEDPRNRRFHAEPVACPLCGPRLWLDDLEGEAALEAAERVIGRGGIVALKGLGGYQLACDARSEEAVARLRERKRRFGKPLAIMVEGLAAARALCETSPEEERALLSEARPIVILRRAGAAGVAPSVADGLGTLGIMLPSTPLHHLLLRDLRFPLVMTSGNASEEPIAIKDGEARARLAAIADAFLSHDREILARYDDSVVRTIGRIPVPIRRARGVAPAAVALPVEARRPILALGAHQKNSFCFAKGRTAWPGQHVGDLENAETLEALREAVATYRRVFRIEPELLAHDLHPDYLSTREAERWGLPRLGVQHHHAHLASCLAEHGRTGPAVGLIYDGTGLGTDGTIWGGEVLFGDLARFERRGHLAPLRLPGGARAIRRPGRMALAALFAYAPERDDLAAFARAQLSEAEAYAVRVSIERDVNAPVTTSMGRLFDAVAALLGLGIEARYEGELAARLESLAAGGPEPPRGERRPLPMVLEGSGTLESPAIIRPGPLIVALIERKRAGEDPAALARAFHEAIAALSAWAAVRVAAAAGVGTVVLSGGCFQNKILTERCAHVLRRAGLEVLAHRLVPPNDGGIALGQAAVAAATRSAPA